MFVYDKYEFYITKIKYQVNDFFFFGSKEIIEYYENN